MKESPTEPSKAQTEPILLFNDECGVCRRLARWVARSARGKSGEVSLIERPIGDDPETLRAVSPDLDIWDAYATIHLLMPDGSMKVGGEAVAEVLRNLDKTRWLARSFAISILGFRPFQALLNLAYGILTDVRPLFGCESCGAPSFWLRPFERIFKWTKAIFGKNGKRSATPHFTAIPTTARPARPASG
jgi:predicted DCC family thiol-disulfide oxidoreductase YuxK